MAVGTSAAEGNRVAFELVSRQACDDADPATAVDVITVNDDGKIQELHRLLPAGRKLKGESGRRRGRPYGRRSAASEPGRSGPATCTTMYCLPSCR